MHSIHQFKKPIKIFKLEIQIQEEEEQEASKLLSNLSLTPSLSPFKSLP